MLTFKQYYAKRTKELSTKHGLPHAEVRREMPPSIFAPEWRDYIVDSYNKGENIPTYLWNQLDKPLQYRVLRTPRALKRRTPSNRP